MEKQISLPKLSKTVNTIVNNEEVNVTCRKQRVTCRTDGFAQTLVPCVLHVEVKFVVTGCEYRA
jgi:hypothetical protein